MRRVLGRIDPEVRDAFEKRGVLYVRNFSEALGVSWRTAFQTDDRAEVERVAGEGGYTLEWLSGDTLLVVQNAPLPLHLGDIEVEPSRSTSTAARRRWS